MERPRTSNMVGKLRSWGRLGSLATGVHSEACDQGSLDTPRPGSDSQHEHCDAGPGSPAASVDLCVSFRFRGDLSGVGWPVQENSGLFFKKHTLSFTFRWSNLEPQAFYFSTRTYGGSLQNETQRTPGGEGSCSLSSIPGQARGRGVLGRAGSGDPLGFNLQLHAWLCASDKGLNTLQASLTHCVCGWGMGREEPPTSPHHWGNQTCVAIRGSVWPKTS